MTGNDYREREVGGVALPRSTRRNAQRDGEQDERDERLELPDRVIDVPWRTNGIEKED